MKSLLRRMNALPFELSIQHYFPLQDTGIQQKIVSLNEAAGWDLLRVEEGNFFIPAERERWLQMCTTPIVHDSNWGDLPVRASSILKFIDERKLGGRLFSLGVGLAALEYHIKTLRPSLQVFCSDYGDEAISRLSSAFIECDGIRHFDLTKQKFKIVFPEAQPNDLVLVHRVDPCLSDDEWKDVFSRLAADNAQHVLFVPHQVLNLRYLVFSKRREYIHRIKRTPLASSGAVRTFNRWLRLWGDHYELGEQVQLSCSKGFWLKLRQAGSSPPPKATSVSLPQAQSS